MNNTASDNASSSQTRLSMKILVLSHHTRNDAGNEASFKVGYLTATKMAEEGHDVTFVYPSETSKWRSIMTSADGLTVVSTPGLLPKRLRRGGFGLLDMLYKTRIALQHKFDIVYVLDGHRPSQILPSFSAKTLRESFIIDECWELLGKGGYADVRKGFLGRLLSLYEQSFELPLKKPYDHIITISTALKRRFGENSKVTVLHGGSESSTLEDYDISEARNAFGLSPDLFIVGMSNVTESDDADNRVFFEACSRLTEDFKEFRLLATGPSEEYINNVVRRYGLVNRIIFPGWVDFKTYNMYLSCCNLYVLPYSDVPINSARWPNKLSDYLCLDRPIVTNPTGDVKSLFETYRIGFLCECTPEGFDTVIKNLIRQSTNLSSHCEESLYVANNVLSLDIRVKKILEICEKYVTGTYST